MEKNKRKSIRIHKNEKALNKSFRKQKDYLSCYTNESPRSDEFVSEVKKKAKMMRDNLKNCSCHMCGNPRKYNNGKNSLTLAELKANDFFLSSLADLD